MSKKILRNEQARNRRIQKQITLAFLQIKATSKNSKPVDVTKYRKQKSERLLLLERERQRAEQFRIAKKTVIGKTSVLKRRAKEIKSENKIDKQFRKRKLSKRNNRNK